MRKKVVVINNDGGPREFQLGLVMFILGLIVGLLLQ